MTRTYLLSIILTLIYNLTFAQTPKTVFSDWIQVGEAGFTGFEVLGTDIQFGPNGQAYVATGSYSKDSTYVYTYSNGNWEQVGNAINTSTKLAIAPDGTLYLAHPLGANKFNGISWEDLPQTSNG